MNGTTRRTLIGFCATRHSGLMPMSWGKYLKNLFLRATATAVAALLITAPALAPATAAPSVPITHAVAIATAVSKAKITTSPKSASVASSKTHTFGVKASGSKLKYQWYVKKPNSTKWGKVSGSSAKTKSLKVKASTGLNGAQYRVVVSNSRAKTTSKSAKLTVVTSPKFTTQPKGSTVAARSKVTLSAKARGGSLSYQWQKKRGSTWSNVSKATKPSHTFTSSSGQSTTDYRVRVSNKAGKSTSSAARVVVVTKPKVKLPGSLIVGAGDPATFKSTATGGALSYQWERWVEGNSSGHWARIPGATKANYTFTARSKNEMESYRVIASNRAGKTASAHSVLYVDSSKQDPMAVGQLFGLTDWLLGLTEPSRKTSVTDPLKSELRAKLFVMNVGEEPLAPRDWLRIEYIGNSEEPGEITRYPITGGFVNMDELEPGTGGLTDIVVPSIPTAAVNGGVWLITDEYSDTEQYVQYVRGYK
ncbi:hypothetical protein ACFY5D_09230 [Paeniglutamicibacter sp. NPDC012692]|uniref:hypothetical protein n=1 Tax=Paeniglutamicibacter sp. NPDC012692 TaxID=3364388 RepID=UPI0036BF25B8